ncbi:hypothetical protein ES703_62436 [subsurface metagenome]
MVIGCSKAPKESALPIERPEAKYIKGEILVKFKKGTAKERIEEINKRFGVAVIKILGDQEVYHLRIPEDSTVPQMVKRYQDLPEVEYAQPNYRYRIF